jgi:hypothetical protein
MTKISIALGVAALLISGCSDKPKDQENNAAPVVKQQDSVAQEPTQMYGASTEITPATHTKEVQVGTKHIATVIETMNAANYTYAKINEDGNIFWIAGPEATIAVGDEISYIEQMVMEEFTSKALGKTFDYLLFANTLVATGKTGSAPAAKQAEHDCDSCGPDGKPKTITAPATSAHGKPAIEQPTDVNVAKLADGYTIEELYAKKVDLKDKRVKVNAKVVKVSKNIMSKDWIHLQDGTGDGATSDMIVTATNTTVNVGDTVTTDAVLNTDVDFGYGYFFAVILQEAKFTPVK